MKQPFDFFALGEALIDFISCEVVESLEGADCYQRFVGGQPTNLTRNMAMLGNKAALGACVGDDHFGQYIKEQLKDSGIDADFIQTTVEAPTTLVPVTRTTGGTPDFMIYRGADAYLRPTSALTQAAKNAKIVHTSAFALSRDPARSTILQALQIAHEEGAKISFDPNYHPSIWPDIPNFTSLLERAFKFVDITKPSLDDCARIFSPGLEPTEYAQRFIQWGAKIVVLTMGGEGVLIATAKGEQFELTANEISVKDVTGAGDAYWAGFLTALLEGESPLEAALQGQALAEIKIETVGPLSQLPDREGLLQRAQSIQYSKFTSENVGT